MSFHDPEHTDLATTEPDFSPGWRVVSFIDPAGTGGDLAFTEGLTVFGLPELLLWARPTEGLDPGADWLLTHRERSRLLNRWAMELMAGSLTPHTEREERFDGGRTVARFRFGPPTLVSALNHPYLPPGCRVISPAWSLLRRAPIARPPSGLSPAVTRRMERWVAEAEAITVGRGLGGETLGPGDVLAGPPSLILGSSSPSDPSRFGPMTRWVEARINQVLAIDAAAVATFLRRLRLARFARCEECLLDDLLRLATRSHRDRETREVSRVAQDLSLTLAGVPGQPTPLWRRVIAEHYLMSLDDPPGRFSNPGDDESALESDLRTLLSDGLELLLVSAALADVSSAPQIASATGPWAWALNDERLPGRFWLARPAIRRAVRELLTPVTPEQLAEAVENVQQTIDFGFRQAVDRLVGGLQTTSAGSAQPGALLRRDQRRGLPRAVVRVADQLAGQLLTAMARPHEFPDGCWELVRETLSPLALPLPYDLPTEIA